MRRFLGFRRTHFNIMRKLLSMMIYLCTLVLTIRRVFKYMKTGLYDRILHGPLKYCLIFEFRSKNYMFVCTDLGIDSSIDTDRLKLFLFRVDSMLSAYNINRDNRFPYVEAKLGVWGRSYFNGNRYGYGPVHLIPFSYNIIRDSQSPYVEAKLGGWDSSYFRGNRYGCGPVRLIPFIDCSLLPVLVSRTKLYFNNTIGYAVRLPITP